jgi:hypothetical protein
MTNYIFLRLQEISLRLHPPGGILNARENEYIRRERQLAGDAAKISASGCGRIDRDSSEQRRAQSNPSSNLSWLRVLIDFWGQISGK